MRSHITKTCMELFQSDPPPKKKLFFFYNFYILQIYSLNIKSLKLKIRIFCFKFLMLQFHFISAKTYISQSHIYLIKYKIFYINNMFCYLLFLIQIFYYQTVPMNDSSLFDYWPVRDDPGSRG